MDKSVERSIIELGIGSNKSELRAVRKYLEKLAERYIIKGKLQKAKTLLDDYCQKFNLNLPFTLFGINEVFKLCEQIEQGDLNGALQKIKENASSIDLINFIEENNNVYLSFLLSTKYLDLIKDTLLEVYKKVPCVNHEEYAAIFAKRVQEALEAEKHGGDIEKSPESSPRS